MEIITYLVIILVTFFIVYIPRKIQEKEIKELQKKLEIGNKIMTYAGILGKIISIDENKIIIEVEPDKVKLTIDRCAIAGIQE